MLYYKNQPVKVKVICIYFSGTVKCFVKILQAENVLILLSKCLKYIFVRHYKRRGSLLHDLVILRSG